jgi:sugar lactone lactonase YvrE|tara:strand:- start:19 stop:843 length:825 start_codon:yes stop_codon:yes gene_type:complete
MKTIKHKILSTLFLIALALSANSQSLHNPESITFDEQSNSYFVSNAQSGDIQKVGKDGTISSLVSGYSSFMGIKIYKETIYSAENIKGGDDFVRGFNKNTGEMVFSLSIPKTKQLNDIEIDDKGNLYVSDRSGDKIYKVNLKNKRYQVIDSTIKTPNGLYFNLKNKSLLVCNTVKKGNIYEIDLKTHKTKLLIETAYPHLDGITVDRNGLIYLTSWSLDWKKSILLKYNGNKFYELLTNNSGMADIEYNKTLHTIEIAKYLENSIMSYKLTLSK